MKSNLTNNQNFQRGSFNKNSNKMAAEPRTQTSKMKLAEKYPNENLYKNDMKYKMNKDLSFENTYDEECFLRDMGYRYKQFIKLFILFCLPLYGIFYSFSSFPNSIASIISLLILLAILYFYWNTNTFQSNKNMFQSEHKELLYIRVLLEINEYMFIFLTINTHQEFSFDLLFFYYVKNFIFNIIFDITLTRTIQLFVFQSFVIFFLYDYADCYFFQRVFKNFFSSRLFLITFSISVFSIFQYFIKKGTKELWALYDSYKRSYHIFKKCMFDDYPYPLIIASKKVKRIIYYKNSAADNLFIKIKNASDDRPQEKKATQLNFRKPPAISKQTTDFQYEDLFIFDREFEKIFEEEIEKTLKSKKKFFEFPFKLKKEAGILKFKIYGERKFYEGDIQNFSWYRITVSPCYWKVLDTYMIQFTCINEEIIKQDFINNYNGCIINELNTIIESVDKVCDTIVDNDTLNEKIEKTKIIENLSGGGQVLSTSGGGLVQNSISNLKADKNKIQRMGSIINNNKTFGNLRDFTSYMQLSTQTVNYNHTLWLYYKNNINFIYDMSLTLKVYSSIMSNRIHSPCDKLNMRELMNYFTDYFYTPGRMKNFKIESNISNYHLYEDDLLVYYPYVRVVLFNCLIFFINNCSETVKEKVLQVNLKYEKDAAENEYKLRFDMKYNEETPKISFNHLGMIITNNTGYLKPSHEIEKMKLLDVGILTVYYIVNIVFGGDFVASSSQGVNKMSFFLKGKSYRFYNKKPSNKRHKEPKSIFEQYYNKILSKVYGFNPPVKNIEIVKRNLNQIEPVRPEKKLPVKVYDSDSSLTETSM
jgi:hypothetical protein